MNIITYFKQILEQNFNTFIKKYFEKSIYWNKSSDIGNYINFMTDLDSFNLSLITNIIKSYFEYIDEVFFNTSYRKNFCTSKGFYQRTILTLFAKLLTNEDITMIIKPMNGFSSLIIFSIFLKENISILLFAVKFVMKLLLQVILNQVKLFPLKLAKELILILLFLGLLLEILS